MPTLLIERARVGPNAAIQLIAALRRRGEGVALRVATQAGVSRWLEAPPGEMIDERDAAHLHAAVRTTLAPNEARAALREAGAATGDYLLAHRIPKAAQIALRAAPAGIAARLLTQAIRRNAWTFAGSGRFGAQAGREVWLEIANNPLCAGETSSTPLCVWHEAVFERLFGELVARDARAKETDCCAAGSPCCRFQLRWSANAATSE